MTDEGQPLADVDLADAHLRRGDAEVRGGVPFHFQQSCVDDVYERRRHGEDSPDDLRDAIATTRLDVRRPVVLLEQLVIEFDLVADADPVGKGDCAVRGGEHQVQDAASSFVIASGLVPLPGPAFCEDFDEVQAGCALPGGVNVNACANNPF